MVRLASSILCLVLAACASASDPRLAPEPDAAVADGMPDAPTIDACVPGAEICNGVDDDCDAQIDEDRATESCDGVDNDCDTKVDEDYAIGLPCDGADADVCADGVLACDGPAATVCTDGPDDAPEICDTHDNDCDGATDEGFGLGVACDGADGDACNEGVVVCNASGGAACGDTTGNTAEVCNGIDDDCRNGIDDPWPLGMSCSVGLGMCARSGSLVCNGAGNGVTCSASAGAPLAEVCGNGMDEDCNGADAGCPANDLPSGAIDISAGGTFTVDISAAHDDNWATLAGQDCGNQGGRDAFYQFVLPQAEVVYYDTFGSSFDSVVRIFPGSCTALGTVARCSDDACTQARSQGALELAAGTYCLVLDQYAATTTTGAATLTFKRGGRPGIAIATASGSQTGTTTGKTNLSIAGCEANSMQPDVGYFFLTCPGTSYTISANTCSGTAFDSVIYLRSGAATAGDVACGDDASGCGTGLQSRITNATVSGANLRWLIVDGFGTSGNGAYTLSYTIQ